MPCLPCVPDRRGAAPRGRAAVRVCYTAQAPADASSLPPARARSASQLLQQYAPGGARPLLPGVQEPSALRVAVTKVEAGGPEGERYIQLTNQARAGGDTQQEMHTLLLPLASSCVCAAYASGCCFTTRRRRRAAQAQDAAADLSGFTLERGGEEFELPPGAGAGGGGGQLAAAPSQPRRHACLSMQPRARSGSPPPAFCGGLSHTYFPPHTSSPPRHRAASGRERVPVALPPRLQGPRRVAQGRRGPARAGRARGLVPRRRRRVGAVGAARRRGRRGRPGLTRGPLPLWFPRSEAF